MTHTQQSARQTKGQEGPVQICKFEELKGEFIVKREIGRGSYGVVFKATRND
jgi:predicted Ser/Thr protein kinase